MFSNTTRIILILEAASRLAHKEEVNAEIEKVRAALG
jgi:hypothetical protein